MDPVHVSQIDGATRSRLTELGVVHVLEELPQPMHSDVAGAILSAFDQGCSKTKAAAREDGPIKEKRHSMDWGESWSGPFWSKKGKIRKAATALRFERAEQFVAKARELAAQDEYEPVRAQASVYEHRSSRDFVPNQVRTMVELEGPHRLCVKFLKELDREFERLKVGL
ncbi:MAG: hypothetical protein AAFQ82_25860 [Myxococcota bacterium]